jgi:hypothetical protein
MGWIVIEDNAGLAGTTQGSGDDTGENADVRDKQEQALRALSEQHHTLFNAAAFHDLPDGRVEGWVAGGQSGAYVSVSPEGEITS